MTATFVLFTLSLHDALPICAAAAGDRRDRCRDLLSVGGSAHRSRSRHRSRDRKSTRLNSSHTVISYAVFCLKKKNPVGASKTKTIHGQWTGHYRQPPSRNFY